MSLTAHRDDVARLVSALHSARDNARVRRDYQTPRRRLMALYARRACFICGDTTWCEHREPEVDMASFRRKGQ